MVRRSTPTFIVEMPLIVSKRDDREALIRLELGRRLYNASLGEALRRLDLMRQSVRWQRARAMPKTVAGKPNKQRSDEFRAIQHAYGFTSASISAYATTCKNDAKWNEGRRRTDPRMGAHECQRIAERAFASAEMYLFGVRGRPRFKGKGRPLHSLEGKSDGSSLCWNREAGCLQWGDLRLMAKLPPDGKDPWLEQSLRSRTKFARVVWRQIKGERRWFVQLSQEGLTPLKYQARDGVVGLDVGPSTVAIYSESAVALAPLAPDVVQPWSQSRQILRAMDRSRRATNPKCYNPDGTFKKGSKIDVRSKAYVALRQDLAEVERVLAARRDRSHGRLANLILACGRIVRAEKISYKAFQKNFGRSTKVRAAGALMSKLRLKAERAGGELQDLDTRRLKLSQYDHTTQVCTKKPLSQRWHVLGDGTGVVQRDVYSAFLAAQVDQGAIHPNQAQQAWSAAQSLLGRAGWMRHQPVSVASLLAAAPANFGLPTPERVARQRALVHGDSSDVVGASREPDKATESGLRTPCL